MLHPGVLCLLCGGGQLLWNMGGLEEAFSFLERKMQLAKEKLVRGSFSIFQRTELHELTKSHRGRGDTAETQEDSPPEQWHWPGWQPKGWLGDVYLYQYLQLTASLTILPLQLQSKSCLEHNLEFASPIWDPHRAAGHITVPSSCLSHLAAGLFWDRNYMGGISG